MPPNLVKNCNALANIKLTSDGWITNSAFRSRRFIACHSKLSILNNAGVMWCAKESCMRVMYTLLGYYVATEDGCFLPLNNASNRDCTRSPINKYPASTALRVLVQTEFSKPEMKN